MSDEPNNLIAARKLYIEICADELEKEAVAKRMRVNFKTLYAFSGMKIKYLREIFDNDIAFQAKMKDRIRTINREVMRLNKVKYMLKKDVYLRNELPPKRQNQADFLRFIDAWNQGERDKKKLAKIANRHLDTIYQWLKELP